MWAAKVIWIIVLLDGGATLGGETTQTALGHAKTGYETEERCEEVRKERLADYRSRCVPVDIFY